jgi:hypothetical protein
VTGSNTAANTALVGDRSAADVSGTVLAGGGIDFNHPGNANQGDLSKVNQANTQNIVAGAVNSQIVYQSTAQITPASDVETIIAQTAIPTNGGYVKIALNFCYAMISGPIMTVNIYRGGVGGTLVTRYYGLLASGLAGYLSCAINAVDTNPDPVQVYTATVTAGSYTGQQCLVGSIGFILENSKV